MCGLLCLETATAALPTPFPRSVVLFLESLETCNEALLFVGGLLSVALLTL